MDVTLIKEAGLRTILGILSCIGSIKYGAEYKGASTHFGSSSDQLAMHLSDGQVDTDAVAALAAAALPACSHNLLDITVDAGTWVVADVTSIVADPAEITTVKATIAVDDISGDPEVVIYEKTTGVYGNVPAGKTHCSDLKEYTLAAAGTSLTEINDWIK
jgi:hypothetical protein